MIDGGTTLDGPVLVVGTGLLGTSIGLALARRNIRVLLRDVNPEHVRTAAGLGAGSPARSGDTAQLVVVAVPPDHLAAGVVEALSDRAAVVTDVGSVKTRPLRDVAARVSDDELRRYVGSHPMAGSERSGPLAASADLFDGRTWAITPHSTADAEALALVQALAYACGATPVRLTPEEHDAAVARISHLPHLLASLAAGALVEAPAGHLALSGQGVRDVTRVAAGDPDMWVQIVSANADAVAALLRQVSADLDALLTAVDGGDGDQLRILLGRGVEGTARIPAKHGGPARPLAALVVVVPDHPGELARLLSDVGDTGVNVEDLRIEHDPGRPVGHVELTVEEDRVEFLQLALEDRNWVTHR